MRYGYVLLILGLGAAVPARAHAQDSAVSPPHESRFELWRPEISSHFQPSTLQRPSIPGVPGSQRGTRHALLGGAIGAASGVVVCTVISNLANDSAGGFSTCTLKGYLLTGGAGFALGFLVGWLI